MTTTIQKRPPKLKLNLDGIGGKPLSPGTPLLITADGVTRAVTRVFEVKGGPETGDIKFPTTPPYRSPSMKA